MSVHPITKQASGNPILAGLMETITTALYEFRRRTVEHSVDLRESAEMHRRIYRAIRARDPVEARRMRDTSVWSKQRRVRNVPRRASFAA